MADAQTLPTDSELFQQTQVPEPTESAPAPAITEPPATEPTSKEPPEAAIPSWRLREEADARRAAEARATQLEARLNEIAAHLQQQKPEKGPDFFENPDAATQAIIERALTPYAQETRAALMYLGRMVASNTHGADKVDAAEQAFMAARNTGALDTADYERVVTSPNRYDAVVQWHKRQSTFAAVGDDPAAWFEKQLEERMNDPTFQAKMLERARAGATGKPGTVVIPPSLSRTTAAAGNGADQSLGDMSDSSLFAHAMRR